MECQSILTDPSLAKIHCQYFKNTNGEMHIYKVGANGFISTCWKWIWPRKTQNVSLVGITKQQPRFVLGCHLLLAWLWPNKRNTLSVWAANLSWTCAQAYREGKYVGQQETTHNTRQNYKEIFFLLAVAFHDMYPLLLSYLLIDPTASGSAVLVFHKTPAWRCCTRSELTKVSHHPAFLIVVQKLVAAGELSVYFCDFAHSPTFRHQRPLTNIGLGWKGTILYSFNTVCSTWLT